MKHDTLLHRYLKTQIHVYFLFGIFLLLPASLSASSGKERQISLLEKAEQELYTNPQLAVYYTLGAQDSIHSALGQAQALYVYAQAEKLLGNFDNCIQALYEAESKLPSKEIKLRGNIYNLMSLGYCNLGDYSKAIDLSNDAIALSRPSKTRSTLPYATTTGASSTPTSMNTSKPTGS